MKPLSTKDLELYKTTPNDFDPMPLTLHLDELRNKIISSIIILGIVVLITFSFSRDIISLLIKIAPKDTLFFQIKPGEFFFSCLKVSTYSALLFSSPLIIWQLSSFIFPGLKAHEKKIVLPVLVFSPILFSIGSLFAYFFVAPSMLSFLFSFGDDIISSSISIESYISFALMIMAICGFAFLIPVIIFTLANAGLITSRILLTFWRYAVFCSVVMGAVLTPTPDPFNMGIISSVLIGLYFFSVLLLITIKK